MGTEVEHTPNHAQTVVASPPSASASGSKISMFTRKAGFVIPKNKLSGSMIPVFRGTKKGDNDSLNEEASNKIQRKTKWGPDLTRDASVRRGRALAYQTWVNQISQQLTFGALEIEDDQDSLSTSEFKDGKTSHFPFSQEDTEFLDSERREIIGELLKLTPVLINQEAQLYAGPLPQADSQGHPHTSFPPGIAQTSLFRGSGFLPSANPSAALLSNPVQVSSSNMPSYFGPPPLVPAHALQSQYRPQALLTGQACVIGNSPQPAIPFTVELPSLVSNAMASLNPVVSVSPQMIITNNVISPIPSPFQSLGAPFGHPVTATSYNSASQLQRGVSPLRPLEPVPSAIHPLSVGPMRPGISPSVAMHSSSPNVMPGSIPIPFLGTSFANNSSR